jgi:hypothetical protein
LQPLDVIVALSEFNLLSDTSSPSLDSLWITRNPRNPTSIFCDFYALRAA